MIFDVIIQITTNPSRYRTFPSPAARPKSLHASFQTLPLRTGHCLTSVCLFSPLYKQNHTIGSLVLVFHLTQHYVFEVYPDILFLPSHIDGHMRCFEFGIIMNKTTDGVGGSKICYLGIMIILNEIYLRNRQYKKDTDLPPSLWKQEINSPCEGHRPCTWKVKGIFITRDREFRA